MNGEDQDRLTRRLESIAYCARSVPRTGGTVHDSHPSHLAAFSLAHAPSGTLADLVSDRPRRAKR